MRALSVSPSYSGMARKSCPSSRLARLVNAADVRMIECRRRARLAKESLADVTVEVLPGKRKLERDGAAEMRVGRSIDHAHAPGGERLDDAEVGDR